MKYQDKGGWPRATNPPPPPPPIEETTFSVKSEVALALRQLADFRYSVTGLMNYRQDIIRKVIDRETDLTEDIRRDLDRAFDPIEALRKDLKNIRTLLAQQTFDLEARRKHTYNALEALKAAGKYSEESPHYAEIDSLEDYHDCLYELERAERGLEIASF